MSIEPGMPLLQQPDLPGMRARNFHYRCPGHPPSGVVRVDEILPWVIDDLEARGTVRDDSPPRPHRSDLSQSEDDPTRTALQRAQRRWGCSVSLLKNVTPPA